MGWRTLLAAMAVLAAGCASPAPEPATQEETLPEPVAVALDVPVLPLAGGSETDGKPGPARWPPGIHAFTVQVGTEAARGLVAVPLGEPDTLAVVAHGWGGSAEAHRGDLERLAGRGALAVAMDYRGEQRAFKVWAGVEDVVAATLALQHAHPGIDRTLLYGWSMGGEIALLAPLHAPVGTFDYVFAGAAVTDLEVFWHESPLARADIENETGGPPTDQAQAYDLRSPSRHAARLAERGVARVYLLHAAADWPVPVEHSERMFTALSDAGQPASYYVVTKDRSMLCTAPSKCIRLPAPAGHAAGEMRLMWPFVENRIARADDPATASIRGTYDGDTGEYDPPDS